MNFNWFNLNPKFNGKLFGRYLFKWFNCFRRVSVGGTYWGIGILQVENRHLFYIGFNGMSVLWIGTTN